MGAVCVMQIFEGCGATATRQGFVDGFAGCACALECVRLGCRDWDGCARVLHTCEADVRGLCGLFTFGHVPFCLRLAQAHGLGCCFMRWPGGCIGQAWELLTAITVCTICLVFEVFQYHWQGSRKRQFCSSRLLLSRALVLQGQRDADTTPQDHRCGE